MPFLWQFQSVVKSLLAFTLALQSAAIVACFLSWDGRALPASWVESFHRDIYQIVSFQMSSAVSILVLWMILFAHEELQERAGSNPEVPEVNVEAPTINGSHVKPQKPIQQALGTANISESGSRITSNAVKELCEELRCAICLDFIQSATILPCTHRYCLDCWNARMTSAMRPTHRAVLHPTRMEPPNYHVSCPLCQTSHSIMDPNGPHAHVDGQILDRSFDAIVDKAKLLQGTDPKKSD